MLGWRGGTAYNGFYLSTTGGGAGSFHKITPTGKIDASDIGRTTLAYSADGSRLYAIVQSPALLNAGKDTVLQGVFMSPNGDPAGPYTKIAGSGSLGNSGSALQDLPGYHVGIQAWYNQALAVDPDRIRGTSTSASKRSSRPETRARRSPPPARTGTTAWRAVTPAPARPTQISTRSRRPRTGRSSSPTTAACTAGRMSVTGYGHWADLNASLRTLQYYDAAAGRTPSGALAYWGGLQDNGTSLLRPNAPTNIEPAGGDGGMVLVDPTNGAQRAVGEYTNLAMYRTTDGGHTFTTISPECGVLHRQGRLRPGRALHRAVPGRRQQPEPLGRRRQRRVGHHEGIRDRRATRRATG